MIEDRLKKLKELRQLELASIKPSYNYIEDLDRSIMHLEVRIDKMKCYGVISNETQEAR